MSFAGIGGVFLITDHATYPLPDHVWKWGHESLRLFEQCVRASEKLEARLTR